MLTSHGHGVGVLLGLGVGQGLGSGVGFGVPVDVTVAGTVAEAFAVGDEVVPAVADEITRVKKAARSTVTLQGGTP